MRTRKRRNEAFLPAALLLSYYVVWALLERGFYWELLFAAAVAACLYMEQFELPLSLAVSADCIYTIAVALTSFGKAGAMEMLIQLLGCFFAILLLLCAWMPKLLPAKPCLWLLGIVGLASAAMPYFLAEEPVFVLSGLYMLLRYAGLLVTAAFLLSPLTPFRSRGSLLCSPADTGRMLLLSFISLGIYRIVWLHRLCTDVAALKGQRGSAVREALCLYFVPFYGAYWYYAHAFPRLRAANASLGIRPQTEPLLYLVFSIPGLGLVNQVLLQQELNALALRRYIAPAKKDNVRRIA